MKSSHLSPMQAFLLVAVGVLTYHLLIAVGGRYVSIRESLSQLVGHLLLVWAPVLGGSAFFVWATRGATSPIAWRLTQAVIASFLSTSVSLASVHLLVVTV